MGRSLSLAAYRVLNRRTSLPPGGSMPERPDGELLWLHAAGLDRLPVLQNLAARLQSQRAELNVLVTTGQEGADARSRPECPLLLSLGSDHPAAARQFLNHWRPDMCLWAGGDLMPNLVTQAAARDVPLVLVDIGADEAPVPRNRWLPNLARVTLNSFDSILTRDEDAAEALQIAGVSADRIRVAARLRTNATPPTCYESDLEDASAALGGRPVWLSAATQATELDVILTAHRSATRLVHRLLLILSLADGSDSTELCTMLKQRGLRVADWDAGDTLGEDIQIVLSSEPSDLGLWYRIASTTFVASTFDRKPGGRTPLEAAGLGSAVLHGPNTRNFPDGFHRLTQAGAAIEVRDAEQLAAELVRLAAPDQSARMALAAWDVATEGAELTDNLIDLVLDMLDLRRATGEGA